MSSQSPIPVLIVSTPSMKVDLRYMTTLQAGAGPAGLVLALTLLKNGIPVRIIDKELTYHIGQRGAGISVSVARLVSVLTQLLKHYVRL